VAEGEIPFTRVHANRLNLRRDLGDVSGLAASIESNGLLEPVELAPCSCAAISGAHYRTLDGHRRIRALKMLRRWVLSPSEYRLHTDITPEQEVALLVEANMSRKQNTPAEMHEALVLKGRYGMLKEAAEEAGTSYGNLRNFMSTMGRLVPEVRERVVWRRRQGGSGVITVREARELAHVGPAYQRALAMAGLSHSQLRAAVDLIKEKSGVVSPEEAVRRAKALEPGVRTESRTSAAFAAAYVTVLKRVVRPRDLVALGFSSITAKRTLKALDLDGSIRGGAASPALLEKLRGTMAARQRDVTDFLSRFFRE
jgi:molybdenum-dependent DNA-binding transcriptional regulator ModE